MSGGHEFTSRRKQSFHASRKTKREESVKTETKTKVLEFSDEFVHSARVPREGPASAGFSLRQQRDAALRW